MAKKIGSNFLPSLSDSVDIPKERKSTPYPKSKNSFYEEDALTKSFLLNDGWTFGVASKKTSSNQEITADYKIRSDTPIVLQPSSSGDNSNEISLFPPLLQKSFSNPSFQLPKILMSSNTVEDKSMLCTSSRNSLNSCTDPSTDRGPSPSSWQSFSYNIKNKTPPRTLIESRSPNKQQLSSGQAFTEEQTRNLKQNHNLS